MPKYIIIILFVEINSALAEICLKENLIIRFANPIN